jgi:hypothetical protein
VASEPAVAREKTSPADFGAMLYVAAALVLLGGAIFAYLQYSSKQSAEKLALTPEAKAYVQSLQLSDVEMKATDSYLSQRVIEIQGKIANAGTRPLEVVEIYCIFRDVYGQTILRARVPIVSGRTGGLRPGEMKSFRLPFDEIPGSWNQVMPQLVIAGVKFS